MSVSKGYRREKQAKDLLEKAGFKVFRKPNTKYGDNDIFGLFDIVALDKGLRTWFIQIKSNSTGGALKSISEFVKGFKASDTECNSFFQVWVCHDREGWKVYDLYDFRGKTCEHGFLVEVDETVEDVSMGEKVLEYLKKCNNEVSG